MRTRARRKKENRSHPVSRLLCARAALRRFRRNDHSSRPAVTRGLQRPTRWLRTGRPRAPPYLVLLRAGFCLPSVLPRTRCALTAPFHPYSPRTAARTARYGLALPKRRRREAGGMFSVPLSVKLPCPGVTRRTAHRRSDFPPLDSPLRDSLVASPRAGCVSEA